MATSRSPALGVARIENHILLIRGHRVMIDADLAQLYEVETRALVQAVKRNLARFPPDFMFQLTNQELAILRSQIVISSWGGRRTPPYAFTEQGVAMLSSVLRSERAIAANVAIMRAFVRMREALATHKALAGKISELEQRIDSQDETIVEILGAIRQLMAPAPAPARRPIGFITPEERKK
ncbi:MAG: ORF6N domain-containing protein [Betaproteobacteria bacterium]|nr:MAG: ORF6N domain-containing protein [Betaproteobacteria bacterium]